MENEIQKEYIEKQTVEMRNKSNLIKDLISWKQNSFQNIKTKNFEDFKQKIKNLEIFSFS